MPEPAAIEAALKNPERRHRKLWATREGLASLDGELPPDFPLEFADGADLARLLVLGAGVRRRLVYPDGVEFHFRTYASAGALYPVEIYVACSTIAGIGAGLATPAAPAPTTAQPTPPPASGS